VTMVNGDVKIGIFAGASRVSLSSAGCWLMSCLITEFRGDDQEGGGAFTRLW